MGYFILSFLQEKSFVKVMDSEIGHSGPKTWIPLVTFPGHLFKLALEKGHGLYSETSNGPLANIQRA